MKKLILPILFLAFTSAYAQKQDAKDTLGDYLASEAMMNFFFGKYDESIANCNKAIKLNPKKVKAYYYRGRCYTVLKKFPEAQADLNKVVQLDPEYADNYYVRGLLYYAQNKYTEAMKEMNTCLAKDSLYREALLLRGELKIQTKDYSGAESDFRRYLARYPKEKDGHFNLGRALFLKDQKKEGCDCWRTARKLGHKKADGLITANCPLEDADTSSYLMKAYMEKYQVTPATAPSVTKAENTMESKILYFYASRMRGDDKWKEVLPAEDKYSSRLKMQLERYANWKFLDIKLKAKQKVNNYTWWVKIYMKVEIDGKIDDGEDEVEIRFEPDGKWTIIAVPT